MAGRKPKAKEAGAARGDAQPAHRLAVLVAEGSDAEALLRLRAAMHRHDVAIVVVAPDADHPASLSDGRGCDPDVPLSERGRVQCDGIAMILSASSADRLANDAHARAFVMDAWSAGQAIAHDIGAAVLLDACGIRGDEFVLPVEYAADLLACLPRRCGTRVPLFSRPA